MKKALTGFLALSALLTFSALALPHGAAAADRNPASARDRDLDDDKTGETASECSANYADNKLRELDARAQAAITTVPASSPSSAGGATTADHHHQPKSTD